WPYGLLALNYPDDLIGLYLRQFFNRAAGPSNRDLVNRRRRAQTEMQAPIGMRDVTVARVNFIDLRQASGFEFDARSDRVAIRFRPAQPQANPVPGRRPAVIAKQRRRAVEFVDDYVNIPILVVISESRAARHTPLGQIRN